MADITAIREGIAANLAALPDVQVNAYVLANPTPTSVQVLPGTTTFDRAMVRGMDELEMKVQLFVGLVSDIASQQTLDQYMAGSGALSVKQLVETDPTLGGAAFDASVTTCAGPEIFTTSTGIPLLMCEWTVQVLAHG